MTNSNFRGSIIVPVYNGARTLPACLQALKASGTHPVEILVVDDASTDGSASIAQREGVRVLTNTRRRGPAGARNAGVEQALAPIVLFVDADVLVRPDTIGKALEILESNQDLAALFGSYDSTPTESNFLSQYKNLSHHFVHQTAREEAFTFWAGFGAIRKSVFNELGGFNEDEYRHASIEDIELGLRMRQKNHRIRLEKTLQVTHMKRWTPLGLLKAEILRRAYPWSKLILQSRRMPNDLNLEASQRISAALTVVMIAVLSILIFRNSSLSTVWTTGLAVGLASCLGGILLLNRRLFAFFQNHRGPVFMLCTIPWHLAYYLYSTITFASCILLYPFLPAKSPMPAAKNKPRMATS